MTRRIVPTELIDALVAEIEAKAKAAAPPPKPPPAPPRAKSGGPRGTGGRPDNRVERCRAYLRKVGPSIQGQEGSKRIFHVARLIWNDFAIDEADGYPLLEEFNRGCNPPWEEEGKQGLKRKWDEAVKKGEGPDGRGCKLKDREGYEPRRAGVPAGGPPGPPAPPGALPQIVHNKRQLRDVVADAAGAMARWNDPPALFARGGGLVRVREGAGSPAIEEAGEHAVRLALSHAADWYFLKESKKGTELEPDAPPIDVVRAVRAMTDWPGVLPLAGVSTSPVLRRDGTVHQTPGYDPLTGVLLLPGGDCGTVPENPTQADARAAADALLHGVRQFAWQTAADRSVWLAMCLTLAARYTFDGPSPLFAVVATRPGSGKGTLTAAAGIIGTGRELPATPYPQKKNGTRYTDNVEELGKINAAVLKAGHPGYVFDNFPTGLAFGNPILDSMITARVDGSRLICTGDVAAREARTVWMANGNLITPVGDTVRRTLPARLSPAGDHPSEDAYDGPELTDWARANRGPLFAACVTVVAAYIRAGRPDMHLPHFGAFEAWSDTIRSAIVWAGLPDPWLTRLEYTSTDDDRKEAQALHQVLFDLSPGQEPLSAAEVLRLLDDDLKHTAVERMRYPVATHLVRTVLRRKPPTTDSLGKLFRKHNGRLVDCRRLAGKRDRNKVMRWFVETEASNGAESDQFAGDRGPFQGCFDDIPRTLTTDTESNLSDVRGMGEKDGDSIPRTLTPDTESNLSDVRGMRGMTYADPICAHAGAGAKTEFQGGDPSPASPAADANRLSGEQVKVRGMPSSDPPRSPAIPRGDALKAAEAWVEQRLRAGPILEGDIAREVLAAGLQDAFAKPDVVEVLNRVGERFLAPNQMGWRLPDAPSSAAGAA